jgi:hypothetical protein
MDIKSTMSSNGMKFEKEKEELMALDLLCSIA